MPGPHSLHLLPFLKLNICLTLLSYDLLLFFFVEINCKLQLIFFRLGAAFVPFSPRKPSYLKFGLWIRRVAFGSIPTARQIATALFSISNFQLVTTSFLRILACLVCIATQWTHYLLCLSAPLGTARFPVIRPHPVLLVSNS